MDKHEKQADASPLQFLAIAERLKVTKRRGWVTRGIPEPESVADHSFQMAVISQLLPDLEEGFQLNLLKMVIFHDIPKCISGDIIPADGISKGGPFLSSHFLNFDVTPEIKHKREGFATDFLEIEASRVNSKFGNDLKRLSVEYAEDKTEVARLAHDINAFECFFQAVVYEGRFRQDLKDFLSEKSKIRNQTLKIWANMVLQERVALWSRLSVEVPKILVIFVVGGPGVGKGTQCELAAKEFGFKHISVGEILREEGDSNSRYAEFVNNSMKESVVVPAQLTTALLKARIQASEPNKFLLDGFPRSLDQAYEFEKEICNINFTISLKCSPEVMLERLQKRAELSTRIDDQIGIMERRLTSFDNANAPVESHLKESSRFWEVSCVGEVPNVYADFHKHIDDIMKIWNTKGTG